MKTLSRSYVVLAFALGASMMSQAAHADFLGALKNATTKQFGGEKEESTTSSLPSLSSLLSGDTSALTASSTSNAAGILQYCIKNNVLPEANVDAVKNKLLDKLGMNKTEQAKNTDYQDGLKGILHGKNTESFDLNNLGAGATQLKDKITEKACDIVLNQAKSYL